MVTLHSLSFLHNIYYSLQFYIDYIFVIFITSTNVNIQENKMTSFFHYYFPNILYRIWNVMVFKLPGMEE